MTIWTSRSEGTAARNGTTTHTVTFTSDGSAPFTPTVGRLLVLIMVGGVTSTTPTGWTLVKSAISGTGLYVWSRTVQSGDTAITTTHNAANYLAQWVVYELPAGSAVSGTAGSLTAQSSNTTFAQVTGLPGTAVTVYGVASKGKGSASNAQSCVWTSPWTEDVDRDGAFATTDGAYLTVSYQDGVTATTATPAGTITGNSTGERITFAIAPGAPVAVGVLAGNLPALSAGSVTGQLPTTAVGVLAAGAGNAVVGEGIPGQMVPGSYGAGNLPALTGALTAQTGLLGTLTGTLPAPGGQLTAQQESTGGVLAGALPTPGGALAGLLGLSGTVSGSLPRVAGTLTSAGPVAYPLRPGAVVDNVARLRPGAVTSAW